MNRNVYVNFLGTFPVANLDFYTSNATESNFNMAGEVTINGITKPMTVEIGIHAAPVTDVRTVDVQSYPVRISFVMDINPGDFNMDFETINFINSITMEVRNGVINKSSGLNAVR
jgi:polyisoprenoid-binding protein YceI